MSKSNLNNISTNPTLQKILEGKLQPKKVSYIHKNIIDCLTPAKSKKGSTHACAHAHTHTRTLPTRTKITTIKPGVVAHTFNPSTQEA